MGGWQTWGTITTNGMIQYNGQNTANGHRQQHHQNNQHDGWNIENRHDNLLLKKDFKSSSKPEDPR
jgi:hypothetical protein